MTDTRRDQIVTLLHIADDWIPSPKASKVYRSSDPKAQAGDPYVEDRTVSFAAAAGDNRKAARQRTDRVLAALNGDDKLEPWERAKRDLDRQSSLPALRRLLATLHDQDLYAHTALTIVHGYERELREPGIHVTRTAEQALDWLEQRMPNTIRTPPMPTIAELRRSVRQARGWRGEKARERQDTAIRHLAAEGVHQVDIAARYGLTQQGVSDILRRQKATVAA